MKMAVKYIVERSIGIKIYIGIVMVKWLIEATTIVYAIKMNVINTKKNTY
jgi:hypothetical protein